MPGELVAMLSPFAFVAARRVAADAVALVAAARVGSRGGDALDDDDAAMLTGATALDALADALDGGDGDAMKAGVAFPLRGSYSQL